MTGETGCAPPAVRRAVKRPRVELQFVNESDELFALSSGRRRLVASRMDAVALVHSIDSHYWGLDLRVFPPAEPDRIVFLDASHFHGLPAVCIPKLACFAAWHGLRMECGDLLRRYLLRQKPERERIVATYHVADDEESAMGSARRFYLGKHEETA